jgi:hypothetical protein
MYGCAIALQGEPLIISNLVSLAIAGMANSQLQSGILRNRFSQEQLAVLRQRILQSSDLRACSRALKGEVGLALKSIKQMQSFDNTVQPLFAKLLVHSGMADRVALRYVEIFETASQFPTEDLMQWRLLMAGLEQPANPGTFLAGRTNRLVSAFMPSFSAYTGAQIRHKMASNMSLLAIAIRQFEHKQGRLPTELSQLSEFDIDLSKFHMVDGNIPAYRLLTTSQTTESTAVLWGFNPQPTAENANPSLLPEPPLPSEEGYNAIWLWEFK